MVVKALIEKLEKCDPNAEVLLETWSEPNAKVVQEYCDADTEIPFIYIADDLSYIEDEILEDAIKIGEEL